MAESSLSLGFSDLQAEIGVFVGWGYDSANWTAAQTAQIERIIQAAVRKVYFPQSMGDPMIFHDWSWLRVITSLTTQAPYSTGTVAVTASSTTVTLTTGTWPTWAANGTFNLSGYSIDVATRSSASVILLATAWPSSTATGQTYSIDQRDYDAPDDFGSVVGDLTYASPQGWGPVRECSENQIRHMRQGGLITGTPFHFAVRPKVSDLTGGQRQEFMFYPSPAAAYVLGYRYETFVSKLSASYPYPLGGMPMVEVYKQMCRAEADLQLNDKRDTEMESAMSLLRVAIERDRRVNTPDRLGYNSDPGVRSKGLTALGKEKATYNGTLYE